MGFITGVKKMFGMDADIEELDENEGVGEGPIHEPEREPYINPFKKSNDEPSEQPQPAEPVAVVATPQVPAAAIEQIAKLINEVLPESVRAYIDKDAQRRYISDAINSQLSDFVKQISDIATTTERKAFEDYKKSTEKQLADAKAALEESAVKIKENNEKFLSADRQRRALSQKVQDLEAKVMKCESETEQFELENKSLLNKLKVMQVKSDDVQYFKDENARLSAEINKLKLQLAEAPVVEKTSEADLARIEELKRIVTETEEKLAAELEKSKNTEQLVLDLEKSKLLLEAREKELQNTKSELRSVIDEKMELAKKTTAAELLVKQKEAEIARADSKIEETQKAAAGVKEAEAQVEELKEKLRVAGEELESLREENEELQESLKEIDVEILEEMQRKLDTFEDVKKRKDEKINLLTSDLFKRDDVIKGLQSEINNLHKTIDDNQREFSLKIKELSRMYEAQLVMKQEKEKKVAEVTFDMTELEQVDDITFEPEELPQQPEVAQAPVAAPIIMDEEPQPAPVDNLDIDDNWLVGEPEPAPAPQPEPAPEPTPAPAPAPEQPKETSRQLSLFD